VYEKFLFLNIIAILSNGWTQAGHKKGGIPEFFIIKLKNPAFLARIKNFVLLSDNFPSPGGV